MEPSGTGTSVATGAGVGIGAQDSPRRALVERVGVSYHSATFPGDPFDVGTLPELRRLRRTRASALQRRTIRRGGGDPPRGPGSLSPRRRVARGDGVRAARAGGIPVGPPGVRGSG